MARRVAAKGTASEVFSIVSGRLGPVGPAKIEIQPLTVFVGRQGTGKSLIAQMLYFFRGMPTLVRFDMSSRRLDEKEDTPKKTIRRIADGMRSSHRSLARLTVPNVRLSWQGALAVGGVHGHQRNLTLNAHSATSAVLPNGALVDVVKEIKNAVSEPSRTAVFVPTERLLYAMALGPTSLRSMSAPLILETFGQMMELAGRIQSDWPDGLPDTPQGRWVRQHLLDALGGEGGLRGASWRWGFEAAGQRRQIDLDMASSGQRANWPLSIIPQVLFSLRASGQLADGFTLYVEEPEIHLHPQAQRSVVEVLAYLVKNGVRVVVTTHSLTVLYTINNLLMASALKPSELANEVSPGIRLRAKDVAAYHLRPDGSVEALMGQSGTIEEHALAEVVDDLSVQMNRILARKGPST